ncbi:ABC transporter permease [Naumannella sp. ID2617S]|nr:ABC transporter permease [Naumannella sp. ID2617S]
MSTQHTHPADEREIRRLVSDWRSGRATKTLWEAIQDGYVVVLSVLVIGAMLVALVVRAQGAAAGCTEAGCQSARTLLPFAVLAGALALAAAVARLFGPVLASAAEGFWIFDAPLNRARLLRGRLVAGVLLALVVGALAGALVAALTGSSAVLIAAWAVATGLAAAGMVAFAAAEQGLERGWITRTAVLLFTVLAVAALVVVVGIAAGWFGLTLTNDRELLVTVVVAVAGLVLLLVAGAIALRRLNQIRRARLVSGGSLVSGMAGAMYALDLGLARDIVVERRAVERGHVRPRKGGGLGLAALVRRDLQRLLRTPTAFGPVVATMVVPYACVALGFGNFTPMISALALFGALVPLMGTLRVLTRTVGLARCLPFSGPELRQASLVVPGIAALIWAIVTMPALLSLGNAVTDVLPTGLITAIAGLLGATRWTAAKPIDFGQPMLATQAGALPPGMLANLVRGFEVTLLITAPVVFGGHWLIAAVIAAIVFWFVMGNFDMQALQEQQEQQKQELAKAKAERNRRR